ncbi:MAG: phage holin family protein [Chloroflexota bacterium]|nr:phage holin family protein [Chloroflexota bacterium]
MQEFVLIWIVTTVSLYILSRLPTGIEVAGVGAAAGWGLVLGILNVFLKPVLNFLAWPVNFLTLGLFSIVINGFVFALAAAAVRDVRLRHGCVTAIIGSILLGMLNGLILTLVR